MSTTTKVAADLKTGETIIVNGVEREVLARRAVVISGRNRRSHPRFNKWQVTLGPTLDNEPNSIDLAPDEQVTMALEEHDEPIIMYGDEDGGEVIPSYDPGAADGGRASAQRVEAWEQREAVARSHAYLEGRADGAHVPTPTLMTSFSAAIEADQAFDRVCRERILSGAGRLA